MEELLAIFQLDQNTSNAELLYNVSGGIGRTEEAIVPSVSTLLPSSIFAVVYPIKHFHNLPICFSPDPTKGQHSTTRIKLPILELTEQLINLCILLLSQQGIYPWLQPAISGHVGIDDSSPVLSSQDHSGGKFGIVPYASKRYLSYRCAQLASLNGKDDTAPMSSDSGMPFEEVWSLPSCDAVTSGGTDQFSRLRHCRLLSHLAPSLGKSILPPSQL